MVIVVLHIVVVVVVVLVVVPHSRYVLCSASVATSCVLFVLIWSNDIVVVGWLVICVLLFWCSVVPPDGCIVGSEWFCCSCRSRDCNLNNIKNHATGG